MANPGDFAYTVKQQADIVRIIGEYVKLRKAGAQNYSGLCPFHGEKTPSFSVHASRQYLSLLRLRSLRRRLHLCPENREHHLPRGCPRRRPEARHRRSQGRNSILRRKLARLASAASCSTFTRPPASGFRSSFAVPKAAAAREYLRGRGLDDEAIARFRIGFAPESGFLLRDKLKPLADEDALRESGLFSWKEREESRTAREPSKPAPAALYSKFRNRIMFPICNESRQGHRLHRTHSCHR